MLATQEARPSVVHKRQRSPEIKLVDISTSLSRPFTYFKANNGMIFYSRGTFSKDQRAVRATLVYIPKLASAGYQKIIFNGYPEDKKFLSSIERPELKDRVAQYFTFDQKTQEYGLQVPLDEIDHVFDARDAFQSWFNQEGATADTLRRIREILIYQVGIASADIGVYGSLQCGVKNNGDRVRDYDMTVFGIEHMEVIKAIKAMPQFSRPETNWIDATANGRNTTAKKRKKGATFCITGEDGHEKIEVELKVIRKPGDKNSYEERKELLYSQTHSFVSGVVINDTESLCTPTAYKIITPDDRIITVISSYYDFIGAAYNGDAVGVRGRMSVDGTTMLLSNPQLDYIFTPNVPESN